MLLALYLLLTEKAVAQASLNLNFGFFCNLYGKFILLKITVETPQKEENWSLDNKVCLFTTVEVLPGALTFW